MTLIACPECQNTVSDRARACPHCGFPVSEETGAGEVEEHQVLEVVPVMFGRNPLMWLGVGLLCAAVVGLFVLLHEWLKCRACRLVVTTRRTTLQEGIASRYTNELEHRDVRSVQVSQGFIDRLVGVGTLELSSAGQGDIEIEVDKIPDPQRVAEIIRTYR